MSKFFVTGAAGFAGSGLIHRLINKGHEVVACDIVSPLMTSTLSDVIDNPKLTYIWKAIHDVEAADIAGCDTVIHFAAQADVPMGLTSPKWTVWENVDGVVALLEACKYLTNNGLQRFIAAGSGNEFGRPLYLPIDEKHPLTPHNLYSFSKAAMEMACWSYYRSHKVPITIMSNGACLGPGMRRDIFIFKWLRNIRKGLPVVLEGGDQTRDLTYVSDILDAWECVLNVHPDKIVGEKFQVSYGKEISVKDILEMCFEVAGKRVEVIHRDYRPGEQGQRELFTNQKARNMVGYAPKVDPKQGIQLTWDWVKTLTEY